MQFYMKLRLKIHAIGGPAQSYHGFNSRGFGFQECTFEALFRTLAIMNHILDLEVVS